MNNEYKLICGYLIVRLTGKFKKDLIKSLEDQVSQSTFKTSGKVKLNKDYELAAVVDCFAENHCPYQVYVDGKFYCINQLDLKRVYKK